jgi:competence protein ComFC
MTCVSKFEISCDKNAIFIYNDMGKLILNRIKKNRDIELLRALKPIIKVNLGKKLQKGTYVPIPLNSKKLKIRTFNQSEELIKVFDLKAINMLIRTDETVQSEKSIQQRIKNPPQFKLIKHIFRNKNIILVDDLYTTGSTIKSTILTLESHGYKNIEYLTLFKVKKMEVKKIEVNPI